MRRCVPTSGRQGVAEQPELVHPRQDAHKLKPAVGAADFDDFTTLVNDMQNLGWKWPCVAKQLKPKGIIGESRAGQGLVT